MEELTKTEDLIRTLVDQRVEEKLKELEAKIPGKKVGIIASKGTLDMAYPPLILATTAIGMDYEAAIFFTFYGLDIVKKKKVKSLKVAPIANPAMPSPFPIPNIMGMLPGMTAVGTMMMKQMIKKLNWPDVEGFLDICREGSVRMIACAPTMEMTGIKKEDLIDGVEVAGAAEYLEWAMDAHLNLFV